MTIVGHLDDLYKRLDSTGKRLKESSNIDMGQNAGIGAVALLSQDNVLEWLSSLAPKTTSIYDRAMDAQYLRDHVGGGMHRMFDGSHDPLGAWEKVAAASTTDSIPAELAGYVTAMYKDATTPAGLPFATWDPASYQSASSWFADMVPGASKSWFADLVSYNPAEMLGCGVVVVCTLLGMKKEDEEAVGSALGSSLSIGVITGNPLMLLAAVVMAAVAYKRKTRTNVASFVQGGALGAIGLAVFEVLSLPILVELVAVIVVLVLAKKGMDWTKQRLDAVGNSLHEQLALPVPSTGN